VYWLREVEPGRPPGHRDLSVSLIRSPACPDRSTAPTGLHLKGGSGCSGDGAVDHGFQRCGQGDQTVEEAPSSTEGCCPFTCRTIRAQRQIEGLARTPNLGALGAVVAGYPKTEGVSLGAAFDQVPCPSWH